jgi:hypothetical protein
MQGLETARFYICTTFLAGSIKSPIEALQSLVEGGQLVPGGIGDRLQDLVVLQLSGAVAPIADQRIVAALKVAGHAAVAIFQRLASDGEQLLDLAEV